MAASTTSPAETVPACSASTRPTASRSPRASSPKAVMRSMRRRYQGVPAFPGAPGTHKAPETGVSGALRESNDRALGARTVSGLRLIGLLLLGPWGARIVSGLADLEPDEPGHGHAGLVEQRLDGLLVVGHRRLIQQH